MPGGIPTFPRLPGPGTRSLRTDAEHLALGENEGSAGPLPAAAPAPPVHAVSARPKLVKIKCPSADCHTVYLYHLRHGINGFSVS